ncbi:toxin-antitoxin system TumE family protein [Azospirillum sp. sgz301742]
MADSAIMKARKPKAELLLRERVEFPDGAFAEMVLWRVPEPIPPTTHGLKYRLVYIVTGKRIVGYDNERGKGDHRHYGDTEAPYVFEDVDTLLADFLSDVNGCRGDRS